MKLSDNPVANTHTQIRIHTQR